MAQAVTQVDADPVGALTEKPADAPRWSGLVRPIATRLLWALTTLVAVVVITFLLIHLVPGSPVTALMGRVPAPAGAVQALTDEYGLDQPILQQLFLYAGHVLRGDLGFSFINQQPVLSLIVPAAGATLILMVPSIIIATILGVWLGSVASRRPGSVRDSLVTVASLLQYSAPVFWVGQVLILFFAVRLAWLPAQGKSNFGVQPGLPSLLDTAQHALLPVATITIYYMAITARVSRSSLLDTRLRDFVLTARAKGISTRRTWWVHVMRNAAIPIVTVVGYSFGEALTGTILTETVFGWPGIGSLFVASIAKRDYPVLEGIFIVTALTVILANLLTDVLYGVIDPRLRQARHG